MEYCTKGQLCEMNVDFTISAVHYLNAIHYVPQNVNLFNNSIKKIKKCCCVAKMAI